MVFVLVTDSFSYANISIRKTVNLALRTPTC